MAFGVYIHFPFCRARCPYCDFAVHVVRDIPHHVYAEAVLAELSLRAPAFEGLGPLRSVFFGGGTPSLWEPFWIARVLEAVRACFAGASPASDLEVSLEVNPDDLDLAGFQAMGAAGINRVSLGVQSFDDRVLAGLGRQHSGDTARRAIEAALRAGFDSVSADLIYGGPGHTPALAAGDAGIAAGSGVHHLSSYALTLEELAVDVPLARWVRTGRVHVADADGQAELGKAGRDVLRAAGFARYEISNHARGGAVSRHNLGYWTGEPYLGLGVGAYGALPDRRYGNPRGLQEYLDPLAQGRLPAGEVDPLDSVARFRERVFLGLRLAAGLSMDALAGAFDQALIDGLKASVRRFLALPGAGNLLRVEGPTLRLTEAGLDLHSEVAARLM